MGQDAKFVHLLSNTHKHTACFQPQDKLFYIYIFHFICVCTQKRVNDLLLYICTLYDLVTLGVLLADTRSNDTRHRTMQITGIQTERQNNNNNY